MSVEYSYAYKTSDGGRLAASRTDRPARHPCRRAVDGPSVRKSHLVRQLTLRRKVARNVSVVSSMIHEIRRAIISWIEYMRVRSEFPMRGSMKDWKTAIALFDKENPDLAGRWTADSMRKAYERRRRRDL